MISDTAQTLADIIDTERSLRLELIIVVLIAMEIGLSMFQIFADKHAYATHAASSAGKKSVPARRSWMRLPAANALIA